MNTDIIEGLNDDEIMSLYNDTIVDGFEDGVQTGRCSCWTESLGFVNFGDHYYGHCRLMRERIADKPTCQTWCTSYHRFSFNSFNNDCWCPSIRGIMHTFAGGFTRCR